MQELDQESASDPEGCPPPEVIPFLAALPAAALEPVQACVASPDLSEVPVPLPEETSLEPL